MVGNCGSDTSGGYIVGGVRKSWLHYNNGQGLAINSIYEMLEDRRGQLFLDRPGPQRASPLITEGVENFIAENPAHPLSLTFRNGTHSPTRFWSTGLILYLCRPTMSPIAAVVGWRDGLLTSDLPKTRLYSVSLTFSRGDAVWFSSASNTTRWARIRPGVSRVVEIRRIESIRGATMRARGPAGRIVSRTSFPRLWCTEDGRYSTIYTEGQLERI